MKINQKILGAFVVGFSMVFGAYTLSNFGKPSTILDDTPVYELTNAAPERTYLTVKDSDENGIEDWREEFVNKTPLIIDNAAAGPVEYKTPDTITDQVGIQLFQSVLESKGRGNIGPKQDQIVANTAELIRNNAVKDYIYQPSQITVIPSSDEAIRTYANTLGQIIINNNVPNYENELTIIDRAVRNEEPSELDKLDPLIAMYKNMRDQTLATPVPAGFEKAHLDLINVYQANYSTLDGIKLAFADPVVALLRIQRYQDDADGLRFALQNMYTALVPYVRLFNEKDPAAVFIAFSPQ